MQGEGRVRAREKEDEGILEGNGLYECIALGGTREPRDGLRRESGPRWSIETVTSAAAGEPWLESEVRTIQDWTDAADRSDEVKTARSQPETDPLRFYRKRVCLFWK